MPLIKIKLKEQACHTLCMENMELIWNHMQKSSVKFIRIVIKQDKLSLKERIIKYNDGITDEQLVNVTNIINLYKKEIETLYMGNLTNIEKKSGYNI